MNNYPSDEELARWIERIEKEQLYAPAHLKAEILKNLPPKDRTATKLSRQTKIQMFSYNIKITIGMAAALIMLFVMPKLPQLYRAPTDFNYQTINIDGWIGADENEDNTGNSDDGRAIEGTGGEEADEGKLYNRAEWQAPGNNIEGALQAVTDAVSGTLERVSNKFNQIFLNNQSYVQEEL
jgi:hypothetical protein